MKYSILGAMVVVILVVVSSIFFLTGDEAENSDADSQADAITMFTEAQVAGHNSKDDCWTIIDGNVYDLTSYVDEHPGSDEILRACGVDGTTLFNTRTTDDGEEIGSGTSHSALAENQLSSLIIGEISQ